MEKSQIAIDSMKLIKEMLSGDITTEQKYLGMMELDKKYPGTGFGEKAQEFANKFLRIKKPIREERKERPRYADNLDDEVPF